MFDFFKSFKPYYWMGLRTIGGRDGIHFCIQFAGKCDSSWSDFYEDTNKPWKKWYTNPFFQNNSGYDESLGRYRVRFIFMWLMIQW
jgi:hypothetical protein